MIKEGNYYAQRWYRNILMSKEVIMDICCWVTTALSFISYAPQVYKIWKTKQADDLSKGSWIIWVFGASVFELYSILSGDLILLISQSVELGWIILTLILTLKYSKH